MTVGGPGSSEGPRVAVAPAPPGAEGAPPEVRSVYVHAPFCARRCPYCDFAVRVRREGDLPGWIEALEGELRALEREGHFPLSGRLDTLYVGGGTPSLLGPAAMSELARLLGPARLDSPELEWTAEANPESFGRELAAAWLAAGVNRLSFGVQSFHAPTLGWMGRLHGTAGASAAVAAARGAGFHDLSLDLIFALPDGPATSDRDWDADLDAALALEPPHLSLYGLTVEPGTPLARSVEAGEVSPAGEDRYRDEYLRAVERLTAEGYEHYEVSNFARPGHASRHNRVYWEGGPYVGLGNGAHSFSPPVRRWNLREWEDYARVAVAGGLPVDGHEAVEGDARRLERVWLALRTDRGLPWALLDLPARAAVDGWERRGWARREVRPDGTHLRLTAEGWLVLDRLVVELDGALARGILDGSV